MLTFDQVQVRLGAFRLSVNFTIEAGARVSILGPSGAGKSSLLSVIAGFTKPYSGRLSWSGSEISGLEPRDRPMSILFQDNNLFPHLSAFENVTLGLRASLRLSPMERAEVSAALASVGLEGFEDRRPSDLSGGQQSRVALARITLRKRPILLLDEPFSALGPRLKTEMLDLVMDVIGQSGAMLLMVTHDPRDAKQLDGETILVVDGRAAPPVPTADLLANPPPALADYLSG